MTDSEKINKEKITFLVDIIKRYDNYIASTNTKASLIIAFNSLVLGTILLKFKDIIAIYPSLIIQDIAGLLLLLMTFTSFLSLFFVFGVVYPYFGSDAEEKRQNRSLLYFGSVSKMGATEYYNYIRRASTNELAEDLSTQATILANGLKQKMVKMQKSIKAGVCVLFLMIFLVLLQAWCLTGNIGE